MVPMCKRQQLSVKCLVINKYLRTFPPGNVRAHSRNLQTPHPVKVINWTSRSADMYPVEYAWDEVRQIFGERSNVLAAFRD